MATRETEAMQPVALTFREATRIFSISRSELYRRAAEGRIQAVKSGRTTLLLTASLREHLASLPAANFRAAA